MTVNETISAKESQVLKAGLTSLLLSSENPVIVDLTGATVSEEAAIQELRALPSAVLTSTQSLPIFVRPSKALPPLLELRPEETLLEAEKKAASPLGRLAYLEQRLQKRIKELENSKLEVDNRAKTIGNLASDLRNARMENSRLKRLIKGLERGLERLAKSRAEPVSPGPATQRYQEVEKTIHTILGQQGLVPGGGK